MKFLFKSPAVAIGCSLLIPLVIVGYTSGAMRATVNLAGLLDHIAFVLLFFFLFAICRAVFNKSLVLISTLALVLVFSVFFVGNLLYCRFFNTWMQLDSFWQWRDVSAIGTGIFEVAKVSDVVFGLMLPLALWGTSLSSKSKFKGRTLFRMGLVVCLLLSVHLAIASPQFRYVENNPFNNLFRQKARQLMQRIDADSKMKRVKENVRKFKLINQMLYQYSDSDRYPFEQTPLRSQPTRVKSVYEMGRHSGESRNPGFKPFPEKQVYDLDPGFRRGDDIKEPSYTRFKGRTRQPNVVLILMESVRAFEVGAYGAKISHMPNFDRLAREGILFKNIYANGSQTTKSEFAILHSYLPNLFGGNIYQQFPNLSIVSLPTILQKNAYKTLWIGGFSPFYGNKQPFLSNHGVEEFHYSIPRIRKRIGWGPSDEDIFDYALDILSRQKQPFFAEIMTLSNHFPFDSKSLKGKVDSSPRRMTPYENYTEGVRYTDDALGYFFSKLNNTPWAAKTIFIVTGDHGIWVFPNDPNIDLVRRQEIYFRVPMLFWAPKILESKVVDTLGSHLDLAPTLLDVLGIQARNSFLGTSLLRKDTEGRFVFMVHDERWNHRNQAGEYMVDTGPEMFVDHFPFIGRNQVVARDQNFSHAIFSLKEDLLHEAQPGSRIALPPERKTELEEFADGALTAYTQALFNDRISRPEDAMPELPDVHLFPEKSKSMNGQETYVAHAGGEAKGEIYTNSLEALNENYKRGFRFFEVDLQFTPDHQLVLAHDKKKSESLKEKGGFTSLRFKDLLTWLENHPDASIVTDVKSGENLHILRAIKNSAGRWIDNFVPQIYELSEEPMFVEGLGYKRIILTLYRAELPDYDVIEFVKKNRVYAVVMPYERALGSNLAKRLGALGVYVYAHTVNSPKVRKKLLKKGVDGFFVDTLSEDPIPGIPLNY